MSITLTVENFQSEVLESTQPVVVDFWASWCGPCHMIAPVIEELAVDFEGRAKVGKLDIDEHASIAMQFAIRSIPTLLFFEDGQVVHQVFGVAPKKVLADKLNRLLSEGRFRAEEAMLDD
ncbi:thioredoxin [Acidobacteria bacterium AH-259-G07]|nr:thioredoxin [Acidobacteria bacterium AH-259-G07]